MSTILVTGGAGFIGSHLAHRLLQDSNQVIILDDMSTGKISNVPKGAKLIEGSVGDASLLRELLVSVDFCYHLAATTGVQESIESWYKAHQNNLTNTVGLFDLAAQTSTPVVFASSAAVYGDAKDLPITEESPTMPTSPYGLDKLCCEQQARIFGKLKGLKSVCMRFFNVYGQRQDASSPYSGVISKFIDRLQKNEPLDVYGDGSQQRDFIFVADVVSKLIETKQHISTEANSYNVCTGIGVDLNEIIKILFDCFAYEVPVRFLPKRAGDISQSIGSNSKISRIFGAREFTSIEDGLKVVIKHIQNNPQ